MRKEERTALSESLLGAAQAARETNATFEQMDGLNRRWFVGVANTGNHANVLIQVSRGQELQERYLPTDTFTPEVAKAAILELDGAIS